MNSTQWLVAGGIMVLVGLVALVPLAFYLQSAPVPAPAPPPPTPTAIPLKVISYNVQFLPGVGRLVNKRPDADYRARTLGRLLAEYDVIGLNEMFDAKPRELLLAGLRERLGDNFHCVTAPEKQRSSFGIDSGLVIVSRLPILEQHSQPYGNDSSIAKYGFRADGFAAKGVLHAQIGRNPEASFDVFVTHLEARDSSIREAQYGLIAEFVRKHSDPNRPALLLGDFNTDGSAARRKDAGAPYHRLFGALRGARAGAGLTDLWPALSDEPGGTSDQETADGGKRIDYIFLSNPNGDRPVLRPVSMRVNRFLDSKVTALSDHSAVEAELSWHP